jgi:hypothetical protein
MLALPVTYAAVWGMVLRIDLAGGTPATETAGEVLRDLPPTVRIDSSKERRARIRFPVDPKAAILQYHDVSLDWRRSENQVRIEAEPPPMIGLLSRTLLFRRADAWRRVIDGFIARGYAPRQ